MDGFKPDEGVIVTAATNLEENLDAALTKPAAVTGMWLYPCQTQDASQTV